MGNQDFTNLQARALARGTRRRRKCTAKAWDHVKLLGDADVLNEIKDQGAPRRTHVCCVANLVLSGLNALNGTEDTQGERCNKPFWLLHNGQRKGTPVDPAASCVSTMAVRHIASFKPHLEVAAGSRRRATAKEENAVATLRRFDAKRLRQQGGGGGSNQGSRRTTTHVCCVANHVLSGSNVLKARKTPKASTATNCSRFSTTARGRTSLLTLQPRASGFGLLLMLRQKRLRRVDTSHQTDAPCVTARRQKKPSCWRTSS